MKNFVIRLLVLMVLVILIVPAGLMAQYPNIRVSLPTSINPEEISISINPANPLNIVAAANIDYYYYSVNGGQNWIEGRLTSSLGVAGDPCVCFDANGNLYYGHLSYPAAGSWLDRIVVQKSTTGGTSWDDGFGVGLNPPKDQDKEWITADLTNSPTRNNLYMAWTEFDSYGSSQPSDHSRIWFSRSTDQGGNWSAAITISDVEGNCIDSDDTVEGAVPAVGPNGEVYISWAMTGGIVFDKSLDGGVTFGTDVFVTSQPGGWDFAVPGIYRCNGLPITVCDYSSPDYIGNIYIVWSDQRNGTDDTDVFFLRSDDGGDTWGDIIKVNDDTGPAHQFFPWVAVDPIYGTIYVAFYDRRNTTGNDTDVYMAVSFDGGETFRNFQVSQSSFLPDQGVFFGDYMNVAAYGGTAYPIWMRMDGTNLSVWVAIVDMAVGAESAGIPLQDGFEVSQNYPNPFNPYTTISFRLPEPMMVEVSLYNVKGEFIEAVLHEERKAGPNSVNWSPSGLSSGVYFYRVTAGNFSVVKKCVIIK